MFNETLRQSIRFRFLSIITGILIVSTVVVSITIAINERNMLKHSLMTKGHSFASYIAKLSQDPLIMKDSIQLDSIVNEANKDEDIMYAVVRDVQGNPVTSQYASINYRSQRVKDILSGLAKQSELHDILAAVKKKGAIAELSVPITTGADVIGKVTIGMSEHKVRHQIVMTVLFVVALNLVVAFVLGAILFVASKKLILDPITELAHATTRLAQGDLTAQVAVKATGEVRMLVDSFNRMAEDLGKRTRDLLDAQEELVRKEKLSILGQLSGSVGHELRNPLGVMSNAVYFLQMVLADADETTKEYLEIIKKEIDNSQRIITDLLDFARTKTPQVKAVTAHELLNECLGRCAVPENVELRTELPETLPALKVDPLQMGQVLQNLITNGVQAMPIGGALSISAKKVRGRTAGSRSEERGTRTTSNLEPAFIEISVTDTGEGISPDGMKRLFQPLFTTKPKGIGLGLTVCKNLTEANGGKIEVESRLGEGTTFTVILPVGES
ncbi:MAG: integral membrane sensor signal transduction histidine [Geobacteraceae bacterium]|nr:MAG: integral membrane sensor signal transduction histidine [Geobacteraceae bacterium]